MSWESTEVRITPRFFQRVEINGGVSARIYYIRMNQNVVGFRDVVLHKRIRIGDQMIRQFANALQRVRLHQHAVVRNDIRVHECKVDRLASLPMNLI